MFDLRFESPSTWLISGPSQSGKTQFAITIVTKASKIFKNPEIAKNCIFYYKKWQEAYDQLKQDPSIVFVNKIPTTQDVGTRCGPFAKTGGSMVIIDDFMQDITADISEIFTVLSHHLNLTVLLLTQNLFPRNKYSRDISLNSTYIIVFKNPRDVSQISHLAKQLAPGRSKNILGAFSQATNSPYTYLLFDNHQKTPDNLRIRSDIFNPKEPVKIWVDKNCI